MGLQTNYTLGFNQWYLFGTSIVFLWLLLVCLLLKSISHCTVLRSFSHLISVLPGWSYSLPWLQLCPLWIWLNNLYLQLWNFSWAPNYPSIYKTSSCRSPIRHVKHNLFKTKLISFLQTGSLSCLSSPR